MKKCTIIVTVILISIALLVGIAHSWPSAVKGRPPFKIGKSRGYFVWNDRASWNVYVTTKEKLHVFTGTIATDGKISVIRQIEMETGDYISKIGDNKIQFRLRTQGGIDGFSFRTTGSYLKFEFEIDGKHAPPSLIHVGSGNKRAPANPYTVKRK
ncbi:MAG: hypothetical protein K8T10_08325 [Candidatus Eremiobacteraeota bacterium]|nr:hypothetical protein [Candidatus Eremiobacteraeota bacterium]